MPNKNVDLTPAISLALTLCQHDEFERALHVLEDCVPAWYRDNPPLEVTKLKNDIYARFMNVQDYQNNPDDLIDDDARSKSIVETVHRGTEVRKDVEAMNLEGKTPLIVDIGPGEFWLPIGLKKLGLKFKYRPAYLQSRIADIQKVKLQEEWEEWLPNEGKLPLDQPVIFVANEIIEHLRDPRDIYQYFCKAGGYADVLYLSTPCYTYGEGNLEWREEKNRGKLGHWRAYTPNEFQNVVMSMFKGYRWQYYPNEIQLLKGIRNG